MKKLKITNSLKYGTYSLIATAVVLAIIIIANLAVAALPSKYTSITNDKKGIYDISDASRARFVFTTKLDKLSVFQQGGKLLSAVTVQKPFFFRFFFHLIFETPNFFAPFTTSPCICALNSSIT